MNHLTFEEVVRFVSINKLDENAILLTKKVNGHIRNCDKCLELVKAVRAIHDEFMSMNNSVCVDFDAIMESNEVKDVVLKTRIEELEKEFGYQMEY